MFIFGWIYYLHVFLTYFYSYFNLIFYFFVWYIFIISWHKIPNIIGWGNVLFWVNIPICVNFVIYSFNWNYLKSNSREIYGSSTIIIVQFIYMAVVILLGLSHIIQVDFFHKLSRAIKLQSLTNNAGIYS